MVILNRKYSLFEPSTSNKANKQIQVSFNLVQSEIKGRVVSKSLIGDQEQSPIGKVSSGTLMFFTKCSTIKKGSYIIDNRSKVEYNIIGVPLDPAGNGYIFQMEVEVRQK